MIRYANDTLEEFSKDKMVFIVGPRQVGKTTMAQAWLEGKDGLYLTWDNNEDRQAILTKPFSSFPRHNDVVFDELHKYAHWKSLLKGIYDKYSKQVNIVVTGSARLDIYKRSGDSLLGRYELLHLHPFTVGELTHGKLLPPPDDWLKIETIKPESSLWGQLEKMSGFPEPFTKANSLHQRRWSNRRRDLLIKEDVREISQIKSLSLLEHLAMLLPSRIGSPLSINSLREELQVAHDTVSSWLTIFEQLFFCFRITPYSKKISMALKKEQKLYLWDWSQVEDSASRFENMIASHLLKSIHAWNDVGYGKYSLHYVRNRQGQEVDFLIAEKNKPVVLIEAKLTEQNLSTNLIKFSEQLGNIPMIQLISTPKVNKLKANSWIVSAELFFTGLT